MTARTVQIQPRGTDRRTTPRRRAVEPNPHVLDAARLADVRPGLEEQHGMALHRLLAPLDLAAVPATGDEAVDIDSWADLRDLGG